VNLACAALTENQKISPNRERFSVLLRGTSIT